MMELMHKKDILEYDLQNVTFSYDKINDNILLMLAILDRFLQFFFYSIYRSYDKK